MIDALYRFGLRCAYRVFLVYWRCFRPTERGVHVALWVGDRVLLLRNSYRAGETFPSGGVKAGESLAEAALRELREEAGIELREVDLEPVGEFTSREEYKTDRSYVFEARLDAQPSVRVDGREVVASRFATAADARDARLVSIASQYLERRAGTERGSRAAGG